VQRIIITTDGQVITDEALETAKDIQKCLALRKKYLYQAKVPSAICLISANWFSPAGGCRLRGPTLSTLPLAYPRRLRFLLPRRYTASLALGLCTCPLLRHTHRFHFDRRQHTFAMHNGVFVVFENAQGSSRSSHALGSGVY
jgi:hypothetical protein